MNRKMKDSGVEWIGDIPNNWELIPLGKKYIHRNEKVSDKDFEALSVTKNGIYKQLENVAKTNNGDSRKKVCKGDFVINSRSDRKQSCGISDYFGSVSLINIVLSPNKISSKYTKYLLDNYGFAEEFYKHGTGIVADLWSTKFDRMKRIIIPLPDENEQEAIGIYLDKKCLQIDSIIEKSKEVIEEYKKYKKSLVMKTVTKGLNSVCDDWNKYRLDAICWPIRGNTGFKKDELLKNGDYVALQYGKTYKVDEIDESYRFYVNSEFYKDNQVVVKGDTLLISTSETIEDLGHSCFYDREDIGLIGGEQIVIKPNSEYVVDKYLYYLSNVFCDDLKPYATGLKVYRYNIGDLKKIYVSIPDEGEQRRIIEYLDKKRDEIDSIISQKEQLINELEIYKKSLIYECVTGKREVV